MSYPQPSSIAPVVNGNDAFRLKTELGTSGDIYESEVSALGFVVGPDSDIANYLLTYAAGERPVGVMQATISPDRHLLGRIDARMDLAYAGPTGTARRRGRILISCEDIWNPRWRPAGFTENDVIRFVQPTVDVLQYFSAVPSLIPPRSDKERRWQYFAIPSPGASSWLVLPAFGRKSGFFTFLNRDAANDVTVSIYGVKTSVSEDPGTEGAFEDLLDGPTLLAADAHTDFKYVSNTHGLWDMFAIELSNYQGGAMPITVTLTDKE